MMNDDDSKFSQDELDILEMREHIETSYTDDVNPVVTWQSGWSEGWQEGARDQTVTMVRKLLKLGVSPAILAQAADWTIEQVLEEQEKNEEP